MSDLVEREYLLNIARKEEAYGYVSEHEILNAPNAETTGALDDAIQEYIKDGYILAEPNEYVKDGTLTVQMPTIKEAKAIDKIVVYADTYKQEYHKPREWEWCHTCKEYDQERHCCQRFIYVISHSVARLEEEYKPKAGKWIRIAYDIYECSECHQYVKTSDIDAYDWCHHCGAKMERSE